MAYLIDGNNLLGFLFPGARRDPENKLKLVRRLIAFHRSRRVRIILVFDGAPVPDPSEMALPRERFDILHPERGGSADAVITEILDLPGDKRHLAVVSSDREIRTAARLAGARPLTGREFAVELNRALRERRAERELDKNEDGPSALETRLWAQVFKERK
jgi:predicted RNA-binding protein with PIN domain